MRITIFLLLSLFTLTAALQAQSDLLKNIETCDTASWKLVFADEFSGHSLNPKTWYTYFPLWPDKSDRWEYGRTHGDEGQIYTDTNFIVSEGSLKIILKKQKATWYNATRNYISGYIQTKFDGFEFGKYEIRCKLPKGSGLWPAFWLWGNDEIDIFEYEGSSPKKFTTNLHSCYDNPNCNKMDWHRSPNLSKNFHIFSIEWDPHFISWFIDGIQVRRVTKFQEASTLPNPCLFDEKNLKPFNIFPDQKMSLIVNLALWPWGNPLGKNPSQKDEKIFEIDHIRVYQKKPNTSFRNLCDRQIIGPSKLIEDQEATYYLEGQESETYSWLVSKNLHVLEKTNSMIRVKPFFNSSFEDQESAFIKLSIVDKYPCSPVILSKKMTIRFLE